MFALQQRLSGLSSWLSPTRLIKLAALVAVLSASARTAPATGTGVAPVLVPYAVTTIAGNTQSAIGGYGGDGLTGTANTLNGPGALAVDSVGNVYISDQSNALIREWNPQTGILKIIAGVPPSKCTGTVCLTTNPGCQDGVAAVGSPVGGRVQGMVVDGFGNLFFSDFNYQGVWVIYRGGARVASFIASVDSATVASADKVTPGFVYHIAGMAVPKAGGGCTGTIGMADQVLATQGSFHNPLQMGIDGAGNLFVQDVANSVVRVINTQTTTQTFFGVSVPAGFIAAVVGCNKTLTIPCDNNTAFGIPAPRALFSNTLAGMTADQFGNVYELDTKGATGGIYAGVAYNKGDALAKLINAEIGLTPGSGKWYPVINNLISTYGPAGIPQNVYANGTNDLVLRPASIAVDPSGNLYMMDTHWVSVYRVDTNSQLASRINGLATPQPVAGMPPPTPTSATGTAAAPGPCLNGTPGQTNDAYGDGCPISQGRFSPGGVGYVTFDGAGNLYVADTGDQIVRKISLNNSFPSTAVGTSITQTLQVHFDSTNLNAATPFSIPAGSDFTVTGTPTCTSAKVATGQTVAGTVTTTTFTTDPSVDCLVNVTYKPTAPGIRTAALIATATNGGTFPFGLTGTATGTQIAVDGGQPTVVTAAGLGKVAAVAVNAIGDVFLADPDNNRIVRLAANGTQTTVGTGLTNPLGVAVDPQGNVFIADSGNNRILKLCATDGSQAVLTTDVSSPQGLAVDPTGNLYIADTGNKRIVEISPFGAYGPAALLSYSGAQAFNTPVALTSDKAGNIYVADSGITSGLIKILAGGGDLGASALANPVTLVPFGTAFIGAPSGVAIDAAGNLYVSDAAGNVVQEIPSATGPGSDAFALNFPGLKAPAGIALDPNGNLYVADSGNKQVLFDNRSQLTVNFGTLPRFQPAATVPLTVSNIGTLSVTPAVPFAALTGSPSITSTDQCSKASFITGLLVSGLHCSVTLAFQPTANGPVSATESLQRGLATVSISGIGQNPLVTISQAITTPANGIPAAGKPAVITASVKQPNGANIPTGNVVFTYTQNGVAQAPVTQALTPDGKGGASASLTINNPLPARSYVINAAYTGDALDSPTNAAAIKFAVPGIPLSIVATSASFVYGSAVPNLTGTVTGILPADAAAITISFTSAATPSTPVGTYPITVSLAGGNYENYTIPNAVTSTGAPAVVTETPAPLTLKVNDTMTDYGLASVNYTSMITGLVNNDDALKKIAYTPLTSQSLAAGSYPIVPTLTIPDGKLGYDRVTNYTVKVTNGTLIVNKSGTVVNVTQPLPAVLPTALPSAALTVTMGGPFLFGTPTGTLTLQDAFTPFTATGTGPTLNAPPVTLTLAGGTATYTPTDPTVGTHVYTFAFSGDSNFKASDSLGSPTTLIVDVPDFTIVSTTNPIQILPGTVPGGGTTGGQQAANPETATIFIQPILNSTQVVNLTCAVPATYFTCTLNPASVTLLGTGAVQTSVVSISVPATLPLDYKAQLDRSAPPTATANRIAYACLPLAFLAFLPLCFGAAGKRRVRLTRLMVLLVSVAIAMGATGCGATHVAFFTPVPAGPQTVVITGTSGGISRSFTIPVNVQ